MPWCCWLASARRSWKTQGNECADGNFYRVARAGQQDSIHAEQHCGRRGRGIGNLGASAAITTAATGTGVATGMMMPSATNAASGASAIKAAFDAAHPSCGRMGPTSRAARWRWSRAALLRKVGVSPKPPAEKSPQPFALISLSLNSRAMRLPDRRRRSWMRKRRRQRKSMSSA